MYTVYEVNREGKELPEEQWLKVAGVIEFGIGGSPRCPHKTANVLDAKGRALLAEMEYAAVTNAETGEWPFPVSSAPRTTKACAGSFAYRSSPYNAPTTKGATMSIKQKAKDLIQGTLKRAGLQVSKIPDTFNLAAYERLHDNATLAGKPFYNVGSGTFWHPHWTNLDYVADWYKDFQKEVTHIDLMALGPLPIETGTAKIIYTSHTIEHVKEPAVQNLFNEAFRALEPGGVLRVTTGPDAMTDYRALMAGDSSWFYWDEYYTQPGSFEHIWTVPPNSVSLAERWLHHVASPLSKIDKSPSPVKFGEAEILAILNERGLEGALDYFTGLVQFNPERTGNHVSWWSHDKIGEFLRKAGFTNVYRSGFNQSVSPLLRNSLLIDSTHPQMSIYMEAVKS